MHAVGENLGFLTLGHHGDAFSHRTVGEQHKFLNQFIGILSHLDVSAYGLARFINFKAHFGAIKTYRAFLEALVAQLLSQAIQHEEFMRKFANGIFKRASDFGMFARQVIVLLRRLAILFEDGLHLFIGKAAV